jgi:hypothetical protein
MYGLGRLSDFLVAEEWIMYLTPHKKHEVWLCKPIVPVAKAVDTEGFLWGMVFNFVSVGGEPVTVAVNRKLINKSGMALVKALASWGLVSNPGYQKQLAAYISAKLVTIKNKMTVLPVPDTCKLSHVDDTYDAH